jgi:transketolase
LGNEKYTNTGSKDTRSGFGAGMTELGQKKRNVVALCADLIGSLKFDDFKTIQSVFSKLNCRSKHD